MIRMSSLRQTTRALLLAGIVPTEVLAQDSFGALTVAPDRRLAEEISAEVGLLQELTVTAAAPASRPSLGPLAALSLHPVDVLTGDDLRRAAAGTLGETLGWQPGVSSGYFGPGASRPVIRGLEGVRVRMLRDHLGTLDASDTSPDHGVTLDPLLLESVEIHRGPASLIYGNSAIGGAVNARTRVMARERTSAVAVGAIESRYDSASNGLSAAAHATLRHGSTHLAVTGSWREEDDIRIPARARTSAYDQLENPRVFDPFLDAEIPIPNPSGALPNSGNDAHGFSVGISYLPEDPRWSGGAAWSHYASAYGLPYAFPGDATDFFGDYRLVVRQDRLDLEASYFPEHDWITRVDSRIAFADYGHDERFLGRQKDTGRNFVDTAISKDSAEGRIEVHHRAFDDRLSGVVGIHGLWEILKTSRLVVPPPVAIRAPSEFETHNAAIFLLEKAELGAWTFQIGHRAELQDISDRSLEAFGLLTRRNRHAASHAAAVSWAGDDLGILDRLSLTGALSYIRRLPTAVERFAFWNNAAIGRFLIGGDLDGTPLRTEQSLGYEIGVQFDRDPLTLRINGYNYDFENFIYLQETLAQTGGFARAVEYIERPATIRGFEAELDWKIVEDDRQSLMLTLMSDLAEGRNQREDEPLPRMPPLRFGTRLEWRYGSMTSGLEIRQATAQRRVKPGPRPELPTGSHTLVNADWAWDVPIPDRSLTVFLRATNLLNQDARLATSFRKDVAPLPGRSVSVGVRHTF
jgi:iron complex outermembrane receptor protein